MGDFVAIDPGVSGGLAYFYMENGEPHLHKFDGMVDAVLFLQNNAPSFAFFHNS